MKLETSYGILYREYYNYQFLKTTALILDNMSTLIKVYISKKPIGHILMIR